MTITKPQNFNPNHYFNHYIKTAPGVDLEASIDETTAKLASYIDSLSEEDGAFAYADGKWTVKQVLQHLNDTERILAYRAFRISRKDKTNLPGFEENDYAKHDYSEDLSLSLIKEEFLAIRQSTKFLFSKMNKDVIDFEGKASDFSISPRALGWVISGHAAHHLNVLKERYDKVLKK